MADSIAVHSLPQARYSFGGDDHVFVEIDEEMSLGAFFKTMSITSAFQKKQLAGITEICPANAAYLVRFDPEVVSPDSVMATLKGLESQFTNAPDELETRIIEFPAYYDDPWTNETQKRFRDRHQDPSSTDLSYAAAVNKLPSVEAFIAAHAGSPWFVSMVGFVAGLPWLFQMVDRPHQLQVPKYLRPRTDTPKLTIGHGGCFSCIYSVRGAGGYQMFGVTPAPIFDPLSKLPYFKGGMCLFNPGDIVRWKRIDRTQYDALLAQAEAGTLRLKMAPVTFKLNEFYQDPAAYNAHLFAKLDAAEAQ